MPIQLHTSETGSQGPPAALTLQELIRATGIRRSAALRAIDELLDTQKILRAGAGKKASPYRYWSPNSFLSAIE